MAENNNMNPEEFDETDELGTVVLTLDDDTELTCSIVAIFTVNNRDYIALYPEEEDNDEVLLYRFTDNGEDDPEIDNIEDDDEYEAVVDAFDELLDDIEFDEEDDDDDEDDDDEDDDDEDDQEDKD